MSEFSNNFDKLHPRISTSTTHEHETGSAAPDKQPLVVPIDTDSNPDVKRKFPLKYRIIAGVAGVGIASAAAIGIGMNAGASNGADKQPNKAPVANSAPANPSEAASPSAEASPSLTVESLQFNPDAAPEEQAEHYNELFEDWLMAGATQENAELSLNSDLGFDGYAEKIAQDNAVIFAEALYGPDWANDSDKAYMVDYMTKLNAISIRVFFASSNQSEPFAYTMETESSNLVRSNEDGSEFTVETTSVLTNNSDKNKAGEFYPELIDRREVSKQQLTFLKKDGHVYLSSIGVMTQ